MLFSTNMKLQTVPDEHY